MSLREQLSLEHRTERRRERLLEPAKAMQTGSETVRVTRWAPLMEWRKEPQWETATGWGRQREPEWGTLLGRENRWEQRMGQQMEKRKDRLKETLMGRW